MRAIVRTGDLVFYESDGKVRGRKARQFEFRIDDIVVRDGQHLDDEKVGYYLGLPRQSFPEQKKIAILENLGKSVPNNILVPYLYKKLRSVTRLRQLVTDEAKQNLLYLNKAHNICNSFGSVLDKKINYDFFKSASGRVAANIGVITKQDRCKIPTQSQLVQLDFSSFQPNLYQDYFLDSDITSDVYEQQSGQTRQQKKVSWYRAMFSNKIQVEFTNVFGRYMRRPLVYHLQALQTDTMSRLIVYLDELLRDTGSKILMFVFDGLLFDGDVRTIDSKLKLVPWNKVFPRSRIGRYPFKLGPVHG